MGNPSTEETVSQSQDPEGFLGNKGHVFEDSDTADYWARIYEKAQYEGRHRFDPNFTWTPEEEKKLVRKVGLSSIPAQGGGFSAEYYELIA